MKALVFIFMMLILFATSSEAQRKKKAPVKKSSVSKKKPVVKKTAKTTKKRVDTAKPKVVKEVGNYADVWPRCTAGNTHLTLTIYFKKVFTQAVKVDPEATEFGSWVIAPNGWDSLAEGKVLKAIYEAVEPDTMEVYPGFSSYNAVMMNMLVLEKKSSWVKGDLQKIQKIMKDHVQSLGYEFRFVEWECMLPENYENQTQSKTAIEILP